jgi:hypothetical protein
MNFLAKRFALAAILSVAACGGDDTSASTPGNDANAGNTGGQSGGPSGSSGSGGTSMLGGGGGSSNDASSASDVGSLSQQDGGPAKAPDANPGNDGASPDGASGNVITDPSAEDVAGKSWTKIGGCGTYAQSSTIFHTGTHSAEVSGRTGLFCGVANGSLPLVDATYSVSTWARWEAGDAGLGTLNLRLSARVDCANPATQKFVTIVNSVAAAPGTWVSLTGPLTVQTTPVDGGSAAACSMAGQTLSHIYIFVEQVDGTAFPDLYMDDLSAESPQ